MSTQYTLNLSPKTIENLRSIINIKELRDREDELAKDLNSNSNRLPWIKAIFIASILVLLYFTIDYLTVTIDSNQRQSDLSTGGQVFAIILLAILVSIGFLLIVNTVSPDVKTRNKRLKKARKWNELEKQITKLHKRFVSIHYELYPLLAISCLIDKNNAGDNDDNTLDIYQEQALLKLQEMITEPWLTKSLSFNYKQFNRIRNQLDPVHNSYSIEIIGSDTIEIIDTIQPEYRKHGFKSEQDWIDNQQLEVPFKTGKLFDLAKKLDLGHKGDVVQQIREIKEDVPEENEQFMIQLIVEADNLGYSPEAYSELGKIVDRVGVDRMREYPKNASNA